MTLAQDTFVEAWLGRERCASPLEDASAAGPWLRGIARNLWRSHGRKRVQERPLEAAGDPAEPTGDQDPRTDALWAAIAQLPEAQREAVWVRYVEDRPSPEAAALLGLDDSALASRLFRARTRLKELIEEEAQETSL